MEPNPPLEPVDPVQQIRDDEIAALERRLARRSPVGVKAPVALVAIAGSLFLMWMQRLDLAYLFVPRTPISLGAEGDYHLDGLRSNRYAQIHGVPSRRGAYGVERGSTWVMVGLLDSPVLVRRLALPGEEWTVGTTPPRPNPSPFAVRGRLLSREDAGRWEDGFRKIAEMGEVRAADGRLWVLVEGERPGADARALAWGVGLVAFAVLNAWFLIKGLLFRR